jgi:hypothetical protein
LRGFHVHLSVDAGVLVSALGAGRCLAAGGRLALGDRADGDVCLHLAASFCAPFGLYKGPWCSVVTGGGQPSERAMEKVQGLSVLGGKSVEAPSEFEQDSGWWRRWVQPALWLEHLV